MVTRKAVTGVETSGTTQKTPLPYPISPADERTPASNAQPVGPDNSWDLIDMGEARSKRRDSDVSSHGTWDTDEEEDVDEQPVEVPKPLRITPSKQNLGDQVNRGDIPAILKPGSSTLSVPATSDSIDQIAKQALANPWADEARRITPQTIGQSKNPYLQSQSTGSTPPHRPEIVPWSDMEPAAMQVARPPIPAGLLPPQGPMAQQHQQLPKAPVTATPVPPASQVAPHPPPPPAPSAVSAFSQPQSQQALEPVELPAYTTPIHELAHLSLGTVPESSTVQRKPVSPARAGSTAFQPFAEQTAGAPWQQDLPTAQQKWGDDELYTATPAPRPISSLIDHSEPLPPPPPSQPPRTQPAPISVTQANTTPLPGRPPATPRTVERQRNETYQIKHINWQDSFSGSAMMRRSPILTQNANGPCPLMALVNALVLTTPSNANTALMETLSTREQVSLGLLLDAVFDELMSGRRGDSATALPDVTELYAFLLALHTGMNVNPRFVSDSSTAPGFEQTREMKFYSTFNVPLIHGWLPPRNTPAYEAFSRRAQSFEDAQNIQFAELELEDKLRAQGLTTEEQHILQDIQTVKHFLTTWPTQLTDHGLEVISDVLKPGHFAILFRNDHFSTIYKEPTHGALMTLVTDSGYSSHDEIVWESLVDVNGAASEMFSGDFRTVSHSNNVNLNQSSSAGGDDGWQTVQGRRQTRPQVNEEVAPPLPGPRPTAAAATTATASSTEQEDHDFALALQLQEEEDARQRDEDRRRQEQHLSEQFISGQNEGRPPAIPPRRGGSRQSTSIRPPVNRPADAADGPDAPPTYEQSASDRPYRENGAQSSTLDTYDALRRQEQNAHAAPPTLHSHGRRQSQGNRLGRRTSQINTMPGGFDTPSGRRPGQAATAQDAEDRCTIM